MTDLAHSLAAIDAMSPDELPEAIGQLAGALARAQLRLMTTAGPTTTATVEHDITQDEAARLRPAIGLKTIRFLTRTDRVPSVEHGRRRLMRLSDLDAYVAQCRQNGVALGTILPTRRR